MRLSAIVCLLILLYGCNGNSPNESADFESNETSYQEPEPSKTIDWKDGDTYSYDYTEEISKIDSLGNEEIITVYKRNKPSDESIICEPKICKWCSKSTYATNFSIEEYPNINWLRGEPDLNSIFGMLGSVLDGNTYYDLDNQKVRTEWRTNCEYNGPDGFCSEKCKSEYSYR